MAKKTENIEQRVADAKAAGMTQKETAAHIGVSVPTVAKYWPTDGAQHRPSRLIEEKRQIEELVAAGVTSKQIAAQLGISESTVARHRRKMKEQNTEN